MGASLILNQLVLYDNLCECGKAQHGEQTSKRDSKKSHYYPIGGAQVTARGHVKNERNVFTFQNK